MPPRCSLRVAILLTVVLATTHICTADKVDDLVPRVIHRLAEEREVLAPLPKDVLEEAIYHSATYTDKVDDLVPRVIHRLAEVREVLAPLPKDVLEEAIYHSATYYIPIDSETPACRNHSALLFDSFLNYDIWALKMVDASSKGGAGLLDGNIMDLGNHGQCLSVAAPGGQFTGQLCVVETRGVLPPEMDTLNPKRPILPTLRIDLMFSVCVPSSCTSRDVETHMNLALHSVNASATVYNSSCSSAQPLPWSGGEHLAVVTVILLLTLVGLSTWFDSLPKQPGDHDLLRSFSLRRNTRRLLAPSLPRGGPPGCLAGLRVLAMAWMMLGYRMLHLLACPNFRFKYLAENIDSLAWAPVENAQLSVEILFLITGVKVAYNYFYRRQEGGHFTYLQFLGHHYARLTPPLAMVTLLYATVLARVTDGPVWRRLFVFQQEFCQRNWWANLLYVSNYVTPYEMCIPQSWYLAVEFQMYILSPLLLAPLYSSPGWGLVLIAITFLVSTVGGVVNAYLLEIQAGGLIRMDRTREGTNILDYFHTQYRLASFLIGICLGYFVFKINKGQMTLKLSKVVVVLGWTAALGLSLAAVLSVSVFQDPDYVYTPWLDSLYGILHRPVLAVGVAWVVFACATGHGGVVNELLSWSGLIPLSRLTYCVFLVHFFVQDVQAFSTKTAVITDFLNLWYMFFADFFISHLVAAALYLTVEAPVCNILKSVLRTKGPERHARASTSGIGGFILDDPS